MSESVHLSTLCSSPLPMREFTKSEVSGEEGENNVKVLKKRLRSASILSFAPVPSDRRASMFSLGIGDDVKIGEDGEVDDRYMNAALEIE